MRRHRQPIPRERGPVAHRGQPKGATCARTKDRADLALDIRLLGAAYLGDADLHAFAKAGWIEELRPGRSRHWTPHCARRPRPTARSSSDGYDLAARAPVERATGQIGRPDIRAASSTPSTRPPIDVVRVGRAHDATQELAVSRFGRDDAAASDTELASERARHPRSPTTSPPRRRCQRGMGRALPGREARRGRRCRSRRPRLWSISSAAMGCLLT